MPDATPPVSRTELRVALLRALRMRCPSCGEGRLYRSYLKPVDACSACGAPLGRVPSEDGPAWLTVLILGPFLVAVTLLVSRAPLPSWITLPGAALAVTGAVMLALPVVKAGWIGILWAMGKVGESQE
ncbi:MAG: DUF983 domain-containing protein [Hyphomonas sp.]|nr:DUF983 domain-containing protein [Hyphomonas sp.]